MNKPGLSGPLLAYVTEVTNHLELQSELHRVDLALENALENHGNLDFVNSMVDKMAALISETERANMAVHTSYDTAVAALDDGLASTAQSGITRMAGNWLQSKRTEIQRRYSAQEATE